MDPERWRRLQELFERARVLPPEDRAAFLDAEIVADDGLRGEVSALLDGDEGSESFLAGAIERAAADPEVARSLDRSGGDSTGTSTRMPAVGERVGPYRLVEERGRGGMGLVYVGERADDAFQGRVAIKFVRALGPAHDLLERFRRERQILADLVHPNIARLLDAGTTDRGDPYLVMELVEGEPVDAYCDRENLSVERRLALFRVICDAVHFAHQNLVVHRDIKPGNILVTADGIPKLLDFGIAKLLDPDDSVESRTLTLVTTRLLTPEFASPEQVRGGRITTASDVYSVGVLLYLLLARRPPYVVERRGWAELERAICEADPSPPSAVCLPEWRRRLRGDLDGITLRAMEKDPSRRYRSVAELNEDLERHLRNEPVAARPPRFGYRMTRFVKRNRVGVVTASAVALALLGGSVAATVGFLRAEEARRVAERDAASSREVSHFLQEMLSSVKPDKARGREVTVREILDEAAGRLSDRFQGNPEVDAAVRFAVGDSYQALGDFDTALPLIERAVELRRKELGTADPRFMDALDRLGQVYWLKGDFEGSLRCSEELMVLRRRIYGPDHPEVTQTMGNLANTYADMGRLDRAEEILREALAIERRTLTGENRGDLAYTLNNLATVLSDRSNFDEAVALHRESLSLRREFMGEDSPEVAIATMNLGFALSGAKRYDEAEPVLREAVARCETVFGEDHPRLAGALLDLSGLLAETERSEEAEVLARRSLKIHERTNGPRSWRTGTSHAAIGQALLQNGDRGAAMIELRLARAIFSETLGEEHARTKAVDAAIRRSAPPGRAGSSP